MWISAHCLTSYTLPVTVLECNLGLKIFGGGCFGQATKLFFSCSANKSSMQNVAHIYIRHHTYLITLSLCLFISNSRSVVLVLYIATNTCSSGVTESLKCTGLSNWQWVQWCTGDLSMLCHCLLPRACLRNTENDIVSLFHNQKHPKNPFQKFIFYLTVLQLKMPLTHCLKEALLPILASQEAAAA